MALLPALSGKGWEGGEGVGRCGKGWEEVGRGGVVSLKIDTLLELKNSILRILLRICVTCVHFKNTSESILRFQADLLE